MYLIFVTDSKVNSLNEFKKQRTQMTEKFLKQEEDLSKIKKEKDNLLYETEKKLIIAKEQWVNGNHIFFLSRLQS